MDKADILKKTFASALTVLVMAGCSSVKKDQAVLPSTTTVPAEITTTTTTVATASARGTVAPPLPRPSSWTGLLAAAGLPTDPEVVAAAKQATQSICTALDSGVPIAFLAGAITPRLSGDEYKTFVSTVLGTGIECARHWDEVSAFAQDAMDFASANS